MRKPIVKFENLRIEMAISGVEVKDLAECWGCNRDTAARKVSMKSPIMLDEAFKAQKQFFKDKTVPYLFKEIVG